MPNYKLNATAKDDLIRIQHYGINRFGMIQADAYFNMFFEYFDIIAQNPYQFESVDFIKQDYRRCVCGSESIYYKVQDEVVVIMTIIGRQDFKSTI
jgi:toxin ParE1/3/4